MKPISMAQIQDNNYSCINVVEHFCMEPHFTIGSLFAGIGGIDLAFQKSGFKIAWANEIDIKSCETYKKNFNHSIICKDIKDLAVQELSYVDIITGGFPCQVFSVAGHRKGLSDARGSIVFELLKITKYLKPRVLFLENVKNLKNHDNGNSFKCILESIIELGYQIKYAVLNTCEYSTLPQNRERIYIIAFKNEKDFANFSFPVKKNITLSIRDLLEKEVNECFYYNKTKYYELLKQEMTNKDTCYQWRRQYIRENKNNLCPTLTANMGTGGHNVPLILDDDIRKLTPRECARLQGFPDEFILPNNLSNAVLYKQIGNSVSIPVVEEIAKNIFKALSV